MLNKDQLRGQLLQAEILNENVLQTIYTAKWLYIWVPKEYGGLGCSFSEGLKILQEVSQIDGSLGWFVTLCSGANYFSRNLKPGAAATIFKQQNICFGGSGMLGGTAEKVGDSYCINGLWNYATGAPYLTHFTLNAQLVDNGRLLLDEVGEPLFRSFVLEASQVELVPSWKSMGMVATASHSFKVVHKYVHEDYSFIYNQFFTEDRLNHIPFETFADLTLLVNYLGMAYHFVEVSSAIAISSLQGDFEAYLADTSDRVQDYAVKVERLLFQSKLPDEELVLEIHSFGVNALENLIAHITKLYPLLGIRASVSTEEINQIFRDFFTATQHANFRRTI